MNSESIKAKIDFYKKENQTFEAMQLLVDAFELNHPNFAGFGFRDEISTDSILLTAEGILGQPQKVMIPRNILDFDISVVVNLLAHEMHHVRQKAPGNVIEDRNEREFQAYYEMIYHKIFPQIPELSPYYKKEFGKKILEYYKRMGEGSELQAKYAEQKKEIENLLETLS